MWYNGKKVLRIHSKNGAQMAWAIVSGVGSGWLRIAPATPDGVTNIHMILSTALANSRLVDVFMQNNEISQATLQ